MKKSLKIFMTTIILLLIVGCANNSLTNDISEHIIKHVNHGENVAINTDEITDNAMYYNYEVDDTIIQIFAFKASDGTIRTAFNTCGACNPSPNAYFIQKGDYFECQNCGNRFHRDEVGLTKTFGCSPISILDEDKTIDGKNIIISSNFIETYKERFENINIYKNNNNY